MECELVRYNSLLYNVIYVNLYNNYLRNFYVKCKLRYGWFLNKVSKFWIVNKFLDKWEMIVKRYFFVFIMNKIIVLKGLCVLIIFVVNFS